MKRRIIDKRRKEKFQVDDAYLNGMARVCGWQATLVYLCLCRHANTEQEAFPSVKLMKEKLGISRNTVLKGIQNLEAHNVIEIEKMRNKLGKWQNNVYVLIDKSEWVGYSQVPHKDTEPSPSHDTAESLSRQTQVPHKDTKETHSKETHSKDISKEIEPQPSYGREDINQSINLLKEKLGGSPDGSIADNRRFAKLLLDRLRKDYPQQEPVELVGLLLEAGMRDSFHSKNLTSFKYLYYNAQKIVQSVKVKKNNTLIL